MNLSIATIAAVAGIIFLCAAIYKGSRARADRRRIDDEKSAELTGGTPDEPVHLKSPFSAQSEEAQTENDAAADEPDYVWE